MTIEADGAECSDANEMQDRGRVEWGGAAAATFIILMHLSVFYLHI
jgi:hypothetical protein